MIALAPRGWLYRNTTVRTLMSQKLLDCVDPRNEIVRPGPQKEMTQAMLTEFAHVTPYNILAAKLTPNFSRAYQVMARNQTFINEALLACALERYRISLANIHNPSMRSCRSSLKKFLTMSSMANP